MVISTHANHFAPDPSVLDALASFNRIDHRLGDLLKTLRAIALAAANEELTAMVADINEQFYYVSIDLDSAKQSLAKAASI